MHRIFALAGILLIIPLAAHAATAMDPPLKECIANAVSNREAQTIETTRNYHRDWQMALDLRKSRLEEGWALENDKDRDVRLREVDADARDALRSLDSGYRSATKEIQATYRSEEKRCRGEFSERQANRKLVPVAKICMSSDECHPPMGVCSTELGDCRHYCNSRGDCQNYCQGICKIR